MDCACMKSSIFAINRRKNPFINGNICIVSLQTNRDAANGIAIKRHRSILRGGLPMNMRVAKRLPLLRN